MTENLSRSVTLTLDSGHNPALAKLLARACMDESVVPVKIGDVELEIRMQSTGVESLNENTVHLEVEAVECAKGETHTEQRRRAAFDEAVDMSNHVDSRTFEMVLNIMPDLKGKPLLVRTIARLVERLEEEQR